MIKNFIGKNWLIITAHPDDESYMMAGSLLKNHRAGGKNYLLCATFGERGSSHLKKTITLKQLAKIRRLELLKVSKFLKIDKLFTMGLPDRGVKNFHPEMVKKIIQTAQSLKPDFIISYGKDGISGHLDHIAAGRAALAAAKKTNIPFLAFGISPVLAGRVEKFMLARRKKGKYKKLSLPHNPSIKISVQANEKFKALAMHKSQHDGKPFADFPKRLRQAWLSTEYFV